MNMWEFIIIVVVLLGRMDIGPANLMWFSGCPTFITIGFVGKDGHRRCHVPYVEVVHKIICKLLSQT